MLCYSYAVYDFKFNVCINATYLFQYSIHLKIMLINNKIDGKWNKYVSMIIFSRGGI